MLAAVTLAFSLAALVIAGLALWLALTACKGLVGAGDMVEKIGATMRRSRMEGAMREQPEPGITGLVTPEQHKANVADAMIRPKPRPSMRQLQRRQEIENRKPRVA